MNNETKELIVQNMTENLPVLRAKLGLSQDELAKLIGISRSTVIAFEKKQRTMTWNTFLSLLLIFTKNHETDKLLKLFGIYTDELNDILKLS